MSHTYADVTVFLTDSDRFDFHFPADGPGRPEIKLHVHSVTLMASTMTGFHRGIRLSGKRYRKDGERGGRSWSGPGTWAQMPPHVLDKLLKAKDLLP